MSHFDEAYSAVQAALDAGARYADARVMVRRTESMTGRTPLTSQKRSNWPRQVACRQPHPHINAA